MTTAEPTAAERMAVPSASAQMDTMEAPVLALVQPVRAEHGARYTDIYLYTGPATEAYRAYPLRLRWFLNPAEAASMARTLRAMADAIEADAETRIEA